MRWSRAARTPSLMRRRRVGWPTSRQANGLRLSISADIFSLGATLVRAATGRSLVQRGSMYEQVMQIRQGRFDLSGLPSGLRPLVLRCLSRQPRGRPTAEELVRILVGSGARPPKPGWYRATAATAATGDA